jgi:hypothetical protein
MFSDQQKRIIQIALILIGSILGGIFIAPLLKENTKVSGLLGGLIGLMVSIAIFPEMLKGVFEQPSEKRLERIKEEWHLEFMRSWTHPTRVPLLLAIGLFLLLIISVAVIANFTDLQPTKNQTILALTPVCFLFGLSGFLTLRRNEYIDNQGRKYRGFWAILNGILLLLMGWGSLLVLVIIIIFDIE